MTRSNWSFAVPERVFSSRGFCSVPLLKRLLRVKTGQFYAATFLKHYFFPLSTNEAMARIPYASIYSACHVGT